MAAQRGAERVTTTTTPRYRTDLSACSCAGYWYRNTCRHIIAYRQAVALVVAQDVFNVTWDTARVGEELT